MYAKQSDANSRFINVTCTDHGKKVFIDKDYVSAFIRMKKSDGAYVYNNAEVLDDGTVLVTLTQQILVVYGKQTADIVLLATPDVTSDELNNLKSVNDFGNVSVISVMPFYLIVQSSSVDNSIITSTNEFDALTKATAEMIQLADSTEKAEKNRNDAENIRMDNENTRNSNEEIRKGNEGTRISEEETRKKNENARISAEIKRQDDITGETFRITNEELRQRNETERENTAKQKIKEWNELVQNTISSCETATNAANDAVEEFETIKDFTGIIMQSEKGAANGVATLDENVEIVAEQVNITRFLKNNLTTSTTGCALDAYQGYVLNNLIESLQNAINNLPKVYHGTSVPTSDIGKDGDLYFQIIS